MFTGSRGHSTKWHKFVAITLSCVKFLERQRSLNDVCHELTIRVYDQVPHDVWSDYVTIRIRNPTISGDDSRTTANVAIAKTNETRRR